KKSMTMPMKTLQKELVKILTSSVRKKILRTSMRTLVGNKLNGKH
ncbi:hypothetical protein TVAGG3_0750480, partial [Trichomonas vaginalis G3]